MMQHTQLVQKILDEIQFATIATASPTGEPWNTPVFCAVDGYDIYWSSHPKSVHSHNIAANNQVFIVVYNSKAGEGEGIGVYMRAQAGEIKERAEIEHALYLLGKRRGRPYLHIDKFMDNGPQRIYKAQALEIWINDAIKDRDGDFIKDFRQQVTIQK